MMDENTNLKEISISEILGENEDKKRFYGTRAAILSYIRQNPEGVTINMVADAVGVTYERARVILKDLCKRREIYDRRLPDVKQKLFYPNGKLIHKYLQESRDFGSQIFRLSLHEGKRTPRLQIQERKYTLLDGEKVEGSIFVDSDNIDDFIHFIEEMMVKFRQFENEKKIRGVA